MKLTVAHYKQEKSNSCGLAALRMVFSYLGDIVSEKELSKDIKIHSFGSFATDLGLIALQRGYRAQIYVFHLPLLGSLCLPFGSPIKINDLQKIKITPKDKMTFESWKKYLGAGGKMYWDTPRISLVERWIDRKIPVIINVNTASLNKFWKNWDNGHYLVINGVKDASAYVLDPDMPKDNANYSIKKEILLPAWAINARSSSGHMIVIEKH